MRDFGISLPDDENEDPLYKSAAEARNDVIAELGGIGRNKVENQFGSPTSSPFSEPPVRMARAEVPQQGG